jgi:hypothetical protein
MEAQPERAGKKAEKIINAVFTPTPRRRRFEKSIWPVPLSVFDPAAIRFSGGMIPETLEKEYPSGPILGIWLFPPTA